MNLYRKIILICALIIFAFSNLVLAQYKKTEMPLTHLKDKVIDVKLLQPSNSLVRLTSKELGLETIKSGGYKGYSYKKFQNSVVFQGQQPILLSKNEKFIYRNVTENKLFTYEKRWGVDSISFKLYDLNNLKLSLIKEVVKPMPFLIPYNTKGNVVVLTDFDIRFGRTLEIYNSDNFKALATIKPFEDIGFQSMMFFEDDLFLHILFKPARNNSYPEEAIKIFKISLKTGEIINKTTLNIPLNIYGFYVTDKNFIMYAYNKVVAYNFFGKQVWSRTMTIPRRNIKADTKAKILYMGLSKKIVALNLSNGQTLWEKSFSEFYTDNLMPPTNKIANIEIRPIFFNIIDNKLAVIISQTSKGLTISNDMKYLTKLFIFDVSGNTSAIENILSSETTLFKCYFKNVNDFTIINDNSITTYEK